MQREKLELENLVQQTRLAARRDHLAPHRRARRAQRRAGRHRAAQQERHGRSRADAPHAPKARQDLPTLRTQLTARLDAISRHLTEFRAREDTRIRTYRERVQHMRTRISVLERESRSLHESLREEQRIAMIDALTGIPNRAAYDDRIEQEFKRWKRFARP